MAGPGAASPCLCGHDLSCCRAACMVCPTMLAQGAALQLKSLFSQDAAGSWLLCESHSSPVCLSFVLPAWSCCRLAS